MHATSRMTFESESLPYVRFELPVFDRWAPVQRVDFPNGVRFVLPMPDGALRYVAPQVRVVRRIRDGSVLSAAPPPEPSATSINPHGVRYALLRNAFRSPPSLEYGRSAAEPWDLLSFYADDVVVDVLVWADESFPRSEFAETVVGTFRFDTARMPRGGGLHRATVEVLRRETRGPADVHEERDQSVRERGAVLRLRDSGVRRGVRLFEVASIGAVAIVLEPLNEYSLLGLSAEPAGTDAPRGASPWARALALGETFGLVDAVAPAHSVEWRVRVIGIEPYPPIAPALQDALREIAAAECARRSLDPARYRFDLRETSDGYAVTAIDAAADPNQRVLGSPGRLPALELRVDKATLEIVAAHFVR